MERNYPEIIISDEGVTWLDKGQMWMYKNNLEQCDPQIKNGELVVSGNMNEFVKDGETLESVFMEVVSDGSSN